jgi:hypothetical protein
MGQPGPSAGQVVAGSHSVRPVDGRRAYPDDDQEPRWNPSWRGAADDGYRVPEPRGGHAREPEPERPGDRLEGGFDGFAIGGARAGGGYGDGDYDGAEQPWDAPTHQRGGPQAQAAMPLAPPVPSAPPVTSGPPQAADPARPVSGEPFRPTGPPTVDEQAEPANPFDTPTNAMPPVSPREAPRFHTEALDRSALRRPGGPTAAVGDGVYRTKRPVIALAYAAVTLIFEVAAVRVFANGMFGDPFQPAGVVAGAFLIAGLPLFALGLYGASGGGARADGGGAPAWLRSPAVYLLAGLGLLVAAGLAI